MGVAFTLITLLLGSTFTGLVLWVGVELSGQTGSPASLLLAALVCNIAVLLPPTGSIASFVLLLYLVRRWTTSERWWDCLLAVLVSWGLSIAGTNILMDIL